MIAAPPNDFIPECPAGHGPMRQVPADRLSAESRWCGTWWECRHTTFRCWNAYLSPSLELRASQRGAPA